MDDLLVQLPEVVTIHLQHLKLLETTLTWEIRLIDGETHLNLCWRDATSYKSENTRTPQKMGASKPSSRIPVASNVTPQKLPFKSTLTPRIVKTPSKPPQSVAGLNKTGESHKNQTLETSATRGKTIGEPHQSQTPETIATRVNIIGESHQSQTPETIPTRVNSIGNHTFAETQTVESMATQSTDIQTMVTMADCIQSVETQTMETITTQPVSSQTTETMATKTEETQTLKPKIQNEETQTVQTIATMSSGSQTVETMATQTIGTQTFRPTGVQNVGIQSAGITSTVEAQTIKIETNDIATQSTSCQSTLSTTENSLNDKSGINNQSSQSETTDSNSQTPSQNDLEGGDDSELEGDLNSNPEDESELDTKSEQINVKHYRVVTSDWEFSSKFTFGFNSIMGVANHRKNGDIGVIRMFRPLKLRPETRMDESHVLNVSQTSEDEHDTMTWYRRWLRADDENKGEEEDLQTWIKLKHLFFQYLENREALDEASRGTKWTISPMVNRSFVGCEKVSYIQAALRPKHSINQFQAAQLMEINTEHVDDDGNVTYKFHIDTENWLEYSMWKESCKYIATNQEIEHVINVFKIYTKEHCNNEQSSMSRDEVDPSETVLYCRKPLEIQHHGWEKLLAGCYTWYVAVADSDDDFCGVVEIRSQGQCKFHFILDDNGQTNEECYDLYETMKQEQVPIRPGTHNWLKAEASKVLSNFEKKHPTYFCP